MYSKVMKGHYSHKIFASIGSDCGGIEVKTLDYALENVKTSGAYVLYNGYFVFQVGPTKNGDKLGVVRLGGHRKNEESPLDTAIREVLEESSIQINPVNSPVTYHLNGWKEKANNVLMTGEVNPILIKGNEEEAFSVMYISLAGKEPCPSSESQGLLLLSPKDIELICSREITLNEFLNLNGLVKIKENFNQDLVLEPFPQLLFLSNLLKQEPEHIEQFIERSKQE